MLDNADAPIELFHGYTYSGHPLATAAALASLDAYGEDEMFQNAQNLTDYWAECAHGLKDLNNVIDIRTIGLVAGIELSSRPGAIGARAYEVMKAAWEKGLMVRVTGDTLAFSPPLIIDKAQIDQLFEITADVIRDVA